MLHIDYAARKDCYAITWSYGEICVGCGCCSKDKLTRWIARLNYLILEREEHKHFSHWIPGMIRLQKRNNKSSLVYLNRRIGQYKRLLKVTP